MGRHGATPPRTNTRPVLRPVPSSEVTTGLEPDYAGEVFEEEVESVPAGGPEEVESAAEGKEVQWEETAAHAKGVKSSPVGGSKGKVVKVMRHNMRGTLTSFRAAALRPDSDPILHRKLNLLEPVLPSKSLQQLRMYTGRRNTVLPGGGGGGAWIPPPTSSALNASSMSDPDHTFVDGCESMMIESPVSAASPGREVLRSSMTSSRGFLPKKEKLKPPTSGDLARLSMYLTAQQHNKLKQHIQQIDRSASLALIHAQNSALGSSF